MNASDLKNQGFIEVSPGEWCKPSKPKSVAQLSNPIAEPNPVSTDAGEVRVEKGRKGRITLRDGGPLLRITLTSVRKRTLDSDNLIGGSKSLRDAIASVLNLDDADSQIEWRYQQMKTAGPVGTLLQIETI